MLKIDDQVFEVSELRGKVLDYFVALSLDVTDMTKTEEGDWTFNKDGTNFVIAEVLLPKWSHRGYFHFSPSTKWNQGGPIIEQEYISLSRIAGRNGLDIWQADDGQLFCEQNGPTALIAAMRTFVEMSGNADDEDDLEDMLAIGLINEVGA